MRDTTLLFCVLLLVHGVFGDTDAVKTVSVMEGDSVTLNPDPTDFQGDEEIIWKFGDVIIAKMKETYGIIYTNDVMFRYRLKLDKQNGYLTITNIRTEHAGHFSVDIKKSTEAKLKTFQVTVHDVVESVSVVEGDTVTLHTGVTDIQRDDQILWKFGDQVINTDRLSGPVDSRWKNIDQNDQTREITISNIRRDQSGDYKMEINTSSMIVHRKLYIAVGEMKTVSVMEGEPIILYTGLIEIQGHDLILWKFEDHLIADINKGTNRFLTHDTSAGGKFKGRLQLSEKSGSLTIRGSRISDSEDYSLHMSDSTHTIQRTIGVTVSDSRSSGAVSGISGASVVLMVWAVTVFL